ncbi:hypothetical protein HID58_066694, partial [Brassica napus]
LAVQTDHEAMANMKTEFMALWDGFSTDPNVRVMVLAATNRPSELDEAILRRLPQAFEIGMPGRKEKAEILKDIFELCKKTSYFPIREILGEEGKGRPCPVPRPFSQLDLEKKVLATSKKTQVAAGEYCGLRGSREPDEVEAAINTTKATFSEKTFGSEISYSQLEIKESKLLEVRIHLKLFTIGVDKELSALVVVAIVEEEETGPAGCSFDFTVAADLLPS